MALRQLVGYALIVLVLLIVAFIAINVVHVDLGPSPGAAG